MHTLLLARPSRRRSPTSSGCPSKTSSRTAPSASDGHDRHRHAGRARRSVHRVGSPLPGGAGAVHVRGRPPAERDAQDVRRRLCSVPHGDPRRAGVRLIRRDPAASPAERRGLSERPGHPGGGGIYMPVTLKDKSLLTPELRLEAEAPARAIVAGSKYAGSPYEGFIRYMERWQNEKRTEQVNGRTSEQWYSTLTSKPYMETAGRLAEANDDTARPLSLI